MKQVIPKEIKEQVLQRVKEGKESVVEIAGQHGIKVNTVYNWLNRGIGINSPLVEINRLKRENQKVKEIIGNLVLGSERGKKD